MAQCAPDVTAPTAVCVGPFTIALNTNGNAPIDPADIDAGSTDNCGAVTLSVAPSNVNCMVLGPVNVTLTVTDNAGNMNTCVTVVTVEDNLAPVFTNCPSNIAVNCGASTAPAATGIAQAADNCGGPLAQAGVDCSAPYSVGVTYCDVVGAGCTTNGITRTWRATYGGLTNSSCVQIITVNDNTNPVIDWNGASNGPPVLGTPPANLTISCAAPVPPAVFPGAATFFDNCDASPTATVTDVSTYDANPAMCANTQYVITRTYKLQDDCGNMVSHVQTITVTNSAPVITAPAAINMPANPSCQGIVNAGQATATVTDCTPLVQLITAFIVRNNVNNQVVNSGSGLNAAGTYPAGNYTVTYSAIDPCGLQGTATMAMNIIDNVSPTAICVAGSIQVSIPPTGTTTLTAVQVNNGSFDNCTPTAGLTYSLTGATFTCADVGGVFPDIVQLTVTDANGNSNTCTSSVNVVNNSPPAVICKNLTVQLDATGNINVLASALDNGSSDACDFPAPLDFDFVELNSTVIAPVNNLTFNCAQVGVNTVRIRVREFDNNPGVLFDYTNDGFCTQTVTVRDLTPPTVVCNNVSLPLDGDGMLSLADAQTASTTYSSGVINLPIPDNDNVTGISSTINIPTLGSIGDINVYFETNHTWVGDLRATLTSPAGTTITLFDRPGVPASGFGCSADGLLVTFDDQALLTAADFEAACIANNPNTYRPANSFNPFEGQNYQGNWVLRVYDAASPDAGNIVEWRLVIRGTLGDLLLAGASDNCRISSWTITPNMFNCGDVGDQSAAPGIQNNDYSITATDPSGNPTTLNCANAIIITDPVAPTVTCSPITVSTGSPDSQNNISTPGQVTVYPTDLVTGGLYMSSGNNNSNNPGQNNFQVTMPNVLTFTFDWSYVSNNSSPTWDKFGYYVGNTFTQLTNDNGPLSQSGSASVSVTAGAIFGFRALTSDNLGGEAEIWITNFSPKFAGAFKPTNWSGATSSNTNGKRFFYDACGVQAWAISVNAGPFTSSAVFNCSNIGAPIPVTIRATDVNSNPTTCNTTVTIIDKESPQAQCQPLLVTLPGSGIATVLATDINFGSTDACSPPVILAISKDGGNTFNPSTTFGCSNIGANNVILRVRDSAAPANEAFCQTTVTIRDLQAPTITCPPNVTIACDQSSAPTATGLATAIDNCAGVVTPTHSDAFGNIVSGNPAGNFNHPNCRIITRTWTASDNASPANTSLCFQTITVQDLVAPSLDWNGATAGLGTAPTTPLNISLNHNIAGGCDVPVAATATGVDNCDTDVPVAFTTLGNTQGSNPANCNFYNYSFTRRWTAADNCGNITVYNQAVNVSDLTAPTYSFPAMLMFNNNPGNCAGTATVNLLDYIADCAADQYLSVSYSINGGLVQNTSNLNTVLPVGTHTVAVRAADPCSNVNNNAYAASFQIVIKDTESPTAICQFGPIPVTLNSSGIANITPATVNNGSNDNCGIASMTVNPASFNCATTPNPHPVVLTVTDAAGNFNTCTTSVQITNVSPPTITCPAAANVTCNVFNPANPATSGGSATAMTACGPVTPTYSDVTVSGPVNCRVITRTWTANTAGGSASCTQTITVTDPTPPTLAGVPANTTAQSCNVPAPATVTASDNCMTPSVTYGQTSTQGANPAQCGFYNYSITRTWSTTDGCNAGVSASQTITVSDAQNPVLTVPNPLIVGTDPNLCNANLNINLADYIADCAADQYLTITRVSASAIGNGSGVITGVFPTGNYSITVTAVDPCGNSASQTFVLSIRDLQAPVAVCDPGITLILDNNGQGSLTAADVDEGSSDNCGAVNLSISPSTFNLSNVGVVPVVLTVTDNATPANSSTCTTPVTVIARGTLRASNTSGGNGSTVSVPISVTGFDNICALSGSLHLAGTAGNVTGVGGFNLTGLDAADFMVSGNNITFSWVNGSPVSLPDGTTIFNVNVQLTGAVGSTSTLTIDGTPTSLTMARCNASVIPITGVPGTVSVITVPSNVTLNGTIQRANSTNVQLVNVGMIGSVNASQTTGAPGTYSFTVHSGSNETITPVKDINDCNGINVIDVLILHQHVLGSAPLATPYLRIAADINNSGTIDVLDELELHLIVLAGNPCIGLANNTSWKFVDASYVFPNPNNPFSPPYPQNKVYTNATTNQTTNFVGMKVGDLDFTANAANLTGNAVSDGNGAVYFNLDDHAVVAGNEYRVSFRASDFYDFVAFQYSLNFDQNVLKYKGMEAGALPRMSAQNFGIANAANGDITSIWYNEEPISVADGEVLFTLVFEAIGNASKLSNLLDIVTDPLAAEAFTSSFEQKDMGINFSSSLSGTNDLAKGKIALYQNRPNPFGNETMIPFYLPTAMYVTLTISDISGKTVKVVNGDFSAGNHQVKLDNTQLPSTGVYFYRIDTEFGSAVKKMVLMD
ncbi:MAG: proprotein convertase P-domain-containing protein [Saprospiraceae bacterium]|nr:proprotein convertase P-domain-containing protein [Saprospiraceae bacterium]